MKYLITIKGNHIFFWKGEFSSYGFKGAFIHACNMLDSLRQTTIEDLHIDCIKRISEGEQEP